METQQQNQMQDRETSRSGVYMRTALYVVLVAAGVFLALQAHQFLYRRQAAEQKPPTAGRRGEMPTDASDFMPEAPAAAAGMYRVEALPPVAPPLDAALRFAFGRPSPEPGNVQLIWGYRSEMPLDELEAHYMDAMTRAGFEWIEGEVPATNRAVLVFRRDDELATVTLRKPPQDETIISFNVTMNRPARQGDFVARTATAPAGP